MPAPPPVLLDRRVEAVLMLLAAVTCFACLDATAKWVNQTLDPIQTACIRYVGSFVLILPICNPWTRTGLPGTRNLAWQCVRALSLVAATVASFFAYRHLPLAQATSISFAAPLIVALLAGPLLGEWPGVQRLAAVAAGFVGVLVVTRPGGGLQWAMVLAFLTACMSAFYTLATRLLAGRDAPMTTLFYSGLIGSAVMLPALPFVWTMPGSAGLWLALAATGGFGALGHWLLILAHQRAPASVLAPLFYGQLVGATVLGWLAFGEVPDRWTIAGGGIVALSGLYLLYCERRVRTTRP